MLVFAVLFVIFTIVVGGVIFLVVREFKGVRMAKLTTLIPPFLVLLNCFCCRLIATNPMNDLELREFKHDFQQIPHPSGSELIASKSDIGLLTGNSNHCDFYVGEMRWTTKLSEEQIEGFYEDFTVPVVRTDDSLMNYQPGDTRWVSVIFVKNETGASRLQGPLPDTLRSVEDWGVDVSKYHEGVLYIVQVFDVGYDPGLDIRCH